MSQGLAILHVLGGYPTIKQCNDWAEPFTLVQQMTFCTYHVGGVSEMCGHTKVAVCVLWMIGSQKEKQK